MKKILMIACMVALLAGCTTRTQYGECVGIGDDKNPTLHYKADVWNVFLGIVFVETVIVPLVVVFDELECPVGVK